MSDPLKVVSRLRKLDEDEARRSLAACLRDETAATDRLRAFDAAIVAETDAASDPSADDQTVETFAVWLRRINKERAVAAVAQAEAEARSSEARAVLAACRSAARGVEALVTARDAQRRTEASRRAQVVLDEAAAQHHARK